MARKPLIQRELPEIVQEAQILLGTDGGDPKQLLDLAKRLQKENRLEQARRVLEKARGLPVPPGQAELRHRILHTCALVTYKNPDQPFDARLQTAEAILDELTGLQIGPELVQDCWGIRGAIHKRRWDAYGRREHLADALKCYRRGHSMGVRMDRGYTAINAAFIWEQLAGDHEACGLPEAAAAARAEADKLRLAVIGEVEPLQAEPAWQGGPALSTQWWFVATIAEAYLGLGRYREAAGWVRKTREMKRVNWEFESTARQFAHYVRLHLERSGVDLAQLDSLELPKIDAPGPPSAEERKLGSLAVLSELFGEDVARAMAAAISFTRGKVGLALSGGGFRASLFHIGVLAKLAELDVLRHVEVISCVSGGSILGAYYYLKLRRLLQKSGGSRLERKDYVNLVQEMEEEFLAGVQTNIRLRMMFGLPSLLKAFRPRRHFDTHRLADLYERKLYAGVGDGEGPERYLHEMTIKPGGVEFQPKYDNWHRRDKAPVLILNATTLNTCRNWQFTATYMGEPPAFGCGGGFDANPRLRRMYHDEAPLYYRENPVRLGDAVAASACVPVLFSPLVLDGLYGKRSGGGPAEAYATRLVDGGNYDNQGVMSLLEQGCSVLLVSDASGQSDFQADPGGGRLEVLPRSNDILQARVREAQHQLLESLRTSRAVRSLLFLHLKKDLAPGTVDWHECPNPSYAAAAPALLTPYEVRRDVQQLLAEIRTDLDTFSNAEADALMFSGYQMAGHYFAGARTGLPEAAAGSAPWRFLKIKPLAQALAESDDLRALRKTLQAAASLTGKPFKVRSGLRYSASALSLAAAGAVVYASRNLKLGEVSQWNAALNWLSLQPAGLLLGGAVGIAGSLWLVKTVLARFHYRASPLEAAAALIFCLPSQILLSLYLWLIEPVYRDSGPKYR